VDQENVVYIHHGVKKKVIGGDFRLFTYRILFANKNDLLSSFLNSVHLIYLAILLWLRIQSLYLMRVDSLVLFPIL
jgi:hypothetical protein